MYGYLVFDHWELNGQDMTNTEEGIEVSLTDFHGGSMFDAIIVLDEEQTEDIKNAIKNKFTPVFRFEI